MLSGLARVLLTSTALAPVLITYAWVAYTDEHVIAAWGLVGLCLVLIVICLSLIRYAKRHLERLPFQATTVEAADRENIAFLVLYMLPLFTDDFATLNWEVWVPALAIFGVVVATGYSYHFNPLLGLLGWHFYKISTKEGVTYVLITKKHLRNATERISVGQLTEYIIIDLEGD